MASKKGSKNKKIDTCLNIEITDEIEFDYSMNTDDLLPTWTQYVFDLYR